MRHAAESTRPSEERLRVNELKIHALSNSVYFSYLASRLHLCVMPDIQISGRKKPAAVELVAEKERIGN
jgi:hypothetical protein